MKQLFIFLILVPLMLFSRENKFPWIVYYGEELPAKSFAPYNPIVLDSLSRPSITELIDKKKEVLGYLNLTQASERYSWFPLIKEKGLLISEDEVWQKDWDVDIRNPFWQDVVLNQVIPDIVAHGFTGLFLDQVDIAINFEQNDPIKYKGMAQASIDLIKAIRKKYPSKRLMLNRGFEILPQVGNDVDYLLAETLYTYLDFKTGKYTIRTDAEYDWGMDQINSAQALFPHLVIFSLDYWDPADKEMLKKIYSKERASCLRPYVTTPSLDLITPE